MRLANTYPLVPRTPTNIIAANALSDIRFIAGSLRSIDFRFRAEAIIGIVRRLRQSRRHTGARGLRSQWRKRQPVR